MCAIVNTIFTLFVLSIYHYSKAKIAKKLNISERVLLSIQFRKYTIQNFEIFVKAVGNLILFILFISNISIFRKRSTNFFFFHFFIHKKLQNGLQKLSLFPHLNFKKKKKAKNK